MKDNLYLPKKNEDAFSDTNYISIVCSRVQGTDWHNIIIETFLIRHLVSCSNFSIWKSEGMHKPTGWVTIYQTAPMWALGCSEKPAQAHQVATVHLGPTERHRQVNEFSRKAYLYVKISVLVHTDLQSSLRGYQRCFFPFGLCPSVSSALSVWAMQRHAAQGGIWHHSSLRGLSASCWGTDLWGRDCAEQCVLHCAGQSSEREASVFQSWSTQWASGCW